MRSTLLALPLILNPAFNAVAAQDSIELDYQDILDSHLARHEIIATARFYNSEEDYEVVPVFNIRDIDAHAVISRRNGESWSIQRYSVDGDDVFQMFSGGFGEGIGTVHIETPNFCTADGLARVSLRAQVRPSMSDLANSEDNLPDIEFALSNIFSRYTEGMLNALDFEDLNANYREQILYPILGQAASEFETRYGVTIADNPDLIVYSGISVTNLTDIPRQERERLCPNPQIRL